jgi:hypothetical protein
VSWRQDLEQGQLHNPADTFFREKAPGIHWLGELQSQSGHGGEEKNPCPCQELNPSHLLTKLTQLMTNMYGLLFGR